MSLDNTSIQALLATSVKAGRPPPARTRDPFHAAAAFADAITRRIYSSSNRARARAAGSTPRSSTS
jgi:hypothetical protein